jgi:hypothetical protein
MAGAARSKPLLLARLPRAQQLHTDVPVDAERARIIVGMEGPVRCGHIDRRVAGIFPAARAVGGGTAVGGRPGEGAVPILRVVLLASRRIGHPTWWSPVAASDQNEDPVSMADPSLRNDIGARALLAT